MVRAELRGIVVKKVTTYSLDSKEAIFTESFTYLSASFLEETPDSI